jgi:hypothetical protein
MGTVVAGESDAHVEIVFGEERVRDRAEILFEAKNERL